jgi:hypothetical protein
MLNFKIQTMSNEILIQCQAKVSFICIFVLTSHMSDILNFFRTMFSSAVWIKIFETSDAKKLI